MRKRFVMHSFLHARGQQDILAVKMRVVENDLYRFSKARRESLESWQSALFHRLATPFQGHERVAGPVGLAVIVERVIPLRAIFFLSRENDSRE